MPIALLALVALAFIVRLWIRNNAVLAEWRRANERIYQLGLQDIAAHRDFTWRWEALRQFSYDRMVWGWRPVSSYFKGHPMLEPGDHDDKTSITCPRCGRTSYHPEDEKQGYCGWCHWWTSDSQLGHPAVIAQAEAEGAITPLPTATRKS